MSSRYLFGPVTPFVADQCLRRPRHAGDCLTFDSEGTVGLAIRATDTWEAVEARLPAGWRPNFIVLSLAYATVPECLWTAPVPIVGLASDADLLWHDYRGRLRGCDLVLTDSISAAALALDGVHQARAANLSGYPLVYREDDALDGPRDLDVVFVGNLNPAVHPRRLPWLGRLARLGRRVAIHTGLFGAAYHQLLKRARIVFNFSRRGECNRRAFEAVASGALLFQEAGNREVPEYFRDRQECVYYSADNLETLLEYFLEHEEERRALVEAARGRIAQYAYEELWAALVRRIEQELPALAGRRPYPGPEEIENLLTRSWQALTTTRNTDTTLLAQLQAALKAHPQSAPLHNALALVLARTVTGQGVEQAAAESAVEHFRRAVTCQPSHLVAQLNLAEALAGSRHHTAAADQARRTLALLDEPGDRTSLGLDAGHFPAGYDYFRVEWERAAWANAGQPAAEVAAKRTLLRWRLHSLLAELTGDLAHHYEALLTRLDLGTSRAALGAALVRLNHPGEAVPYLRQAVADNPFDLAAARTLGRALTLASDLQGQRRLAQERRRLAQTAPQVVPAEPWFAEAMPDGTELASILILCCNQVACTRLCLESVLHHTRPPYELVIVDNGSTDETPAYLEELRSRPGPVRVEVIRNETNAGFPAGCNQALARARGRFLVFLNNDTIVTERWLDGLIAWSLHDWPQVGLVGAVSNYAAAPQWVDAKYANGEEMQAFAARRRREFAGRSLRGERLSAFCMLARREVLERIGPLDERYGLGFFDDDDLNLRVRKAGFQLIVALDVFVHHFGSQTFKALGVDIVGQLNKNLELFKAKWGVAVPAPGAPPQVPVAASGGDVAQAPALPPVFAEPLLGRAPQPAPPDAPVAPVAAQPARPKARVSLCMIVKNEEANLPDCLRSAADLVDEVIVVDTGSTDRTKEVAARLGAQVFDFEWINSFAAARNESLRHATGDWAFWLDADDRIDPENRQRLRTLFANLGDENAAYVMKIRSLVGSSGTSSRLLDQVRLFRNRPYIRWQYRIHEQILPAIGRSGGETRWTDVTINHTGYVDPAFRRRKLERNLKLLLIEETEQPEDSFTLFNLGRTYLDLGQTAEALAIFQRSLGNSKPDLSIVRKLYALIAQAQHQLGRRREALDACRDGLARYPDDAELLFQQALLFDEEEDLAGAEASLLLLLKTQPGAYFDMVDAGLRTYKARHHLAALYARQGRDAEAEAHWRVALAERPDFTPAGLGLGSLFLTQGRWDEIEQTAQRLETKAGEPVEARLLRARACLTRKEFGAARKWLEDVISREPKALVPRVLLSHALLQQGHDWAAAEKALRDILALNPEHAEAKHNLELLLRRRDRTPAMR